MALVSPHELMLTGGAGCLIAAGTHDVVARTIPHWTVLGVTAAGLLLRLQDGELAPALLAMTGVFGLACVCWNAGWMGGGDAKLLGAVTFLLHPSEVLPALAATAVAGSLLALPYLVLRGRIPRPQPGRRALGLAARCWRAERFRLRRGGPLPYGVAIAFGAVLHLWSAAA